ncbi:hypothetical protein L208DRAFT_1282824, partial [Tricholoma matsutake]
YITENDLQTYEILSLLSKAVLHATESNHSNMSTKEQAKNLLHKCLSQFGKQQQIHAQQAACYIQGHADGIGSHKISIHRLTTTSIEIMTLMKYFFMNLYAASE